MNACSGYFLVYPTLKTRYDMLGVVVMVRLKAPIQILSVCSRYLQGRTATAVYPTQNAYDGVEFEGYKKETLFVHCKLLLYIHVVYIV